MTVGAQGKKIGVILRAESLGIPIDLLKKNKYVPFENQLRLISYLRENKYLKESLDIRLRLPDKHQVDLIMELVHDILFSDTDRKESWTTSNLSRLVKYQIYFNPSIKQLVKEHNAKKEDTRIRNVLELVYKYFEFSIPKYLSAFENIYYFVYGKELSLSLMAAHLQYGSDSKINVLLVDAGLPRSIISKLSKKLPNVRTVLDIRNKIENDPSVLSELSKIEVRMLSKRI